jgi:hypothetical protein
VDDRDQPRKRNGEAPRDREDRVPNPGESGQPSTVLARVFTSSSGLVSTSMLLLGLLALAGLSMQSAAPGKRTGTPAAEPSSPPACRPARTCATPQRDDHETVGLSTNLYVLSGND